MENVTIEYTLEIGVTQKSCLASNTQVSKQSIETVTFRNAESIHRTEYGESGVPEMKEEGRPPFEKLTTILYCDNLSSQQLSQAEYDLLSKGLSFIPTQHIIDIWKVQSE